jgi:hypothetical protein
MDKKLVVSVFAGDKNLKEVHCTSDGQVFYAAENAHNHSQRLAKKTVEKVLREDVENEIEAAEKKATSKLEADEKAKADAELKAKEEAEAKAKAENKK